MTELPAALCVLFAYVLGATPTSYWVGRFGYGIDLRRRGSGNLGATNTFRVLAIQIRAGPLTGRCARRKESIVKRIGIVGAGDGQTPFAAAPVIRTPVIALSRPEIGQAIGIAPAGQPMITRPAVEIGRVTAHIDHRVDGR